MDSTANDLFNLLVGRDYTVKTLTGQGKSEKNPGEAEMFSFDFKTANKNYGTVIILLNSEGEMEVFFGDNVGRSMEGKDKDIWFDFLYQLKNFATRNLLTYTLTDMSKLRARVQSMAAINEGLFEGWNGTKRTSYNDKPGTTRLKIVHSRELGEGEQRFRNIEKLYVENTEGERFKLPFTTLVGGRAMARHVAEGGTPYDVFGQHITDMVREANILNRFVRTTKTITEDDAEQYEVVSAGRNRYQTVRGRLKSLAGKRGYNAYKESWDPAVLEQDSAVVDALRGSFITQTVPTQIEEALPYIAQNLQPSQSKEPIMKEFDQFANWAENVTEGTWAIPDDETKVKKLKEILAQPLPVGVDAMNATNVLYDIIGDDELFDRLGVLADQDPEADARSVIGVWIEEYSDSYPGLEDLAARVFGDNDSDELEFEEGLEEGDVIQGKFGAQKMNKYGMSAVKTAQGFFALVNGKVVAGPFDSIDELKAYQEAELNKEAVGEQVDIDTGKEQRRQERDHMLEMNAWRKLAGMQEKVYEDFTAFQEPVQEAYSDLDDPSTGGQIKNREDFLAKSKHLYNMMMDPNLKDQSSMRAIQDAILKLEKQARELGLLEMTEDDRAAKLNDDILHDFDIEEGNAFSGALAKAKASGAAEFEVDGKRYKVTEVDAGKFGAGDEEIKDPEQVVPGGAQDDGKIANEKDIEETSYTDAYKQLRARTANLPSNPNQAQSRARHDAAHAAMSARDSQSTGTAGSTASSTAQQIQRPTRPTPSRDPFGDLDKEVDNMFDDKHSGKKAKPDYLDFDKDGDRKESMKKALADKKKKANEEVELDEAKLDKSSPIYKDYEALKKKSIADLRNIIGRNHRVVDLNGYDKAGAIRQVLDDRYGERKVDAFFGEEPKLDERSLTKGEEKKKEKYVKGMKKSKADFKKRYGDRGEEVMYATATKMAKEGEGETTGGSNMFGKGIYESLTELENDLDMELGHGITATSQLDRPENPVGMLEPEEVGTADIAVVAPAEPKEKNIGDKIADKGMELSASIDAALADIKRLAGMGN